MISGNCRPVSQWTKGAILEESKRRGAPPEVIFVMRGIPLRDLRPLVLRRVCSSNAGWVDGLVDGRPGRRTEYYSLDMDAVMSIGKGV